MIVPRMTAVTMSTAWTTRKLVGLDPPIAPDQARWSCQMATAKRGQITQLNAPATIRNRDQFRVRITCPVSVPIRRTVTAYLRRPAPRAALNTRRPAALVESTMHVVDGPDHNSAGGSRRRGHLHFGISLGG